MNKQSKLCFIVLLLTSGVNAFASQNIQVYDYLSYSYNNSSEVKITIDLKNNVFSGPFDTYTKINKCDKNNFLLCLKSDHFNACIISNAEGVKEWNCNGVGYVFKKNTIFNFLGRSIIVMIIESKDIIYFYSKEHGLIAFSFIDKELQLSQFFVCKSSNCVGSKINK